MTVISLLGGDWEYQFEDETTTTTFATQTGTRMLRYVSGPVRSSNEVYSAVAEAADDFQAMGFKNPMLPVTPNAYTMENQAFISRASSEWLKEGTITANWNLAGTAGDTAGHGVLRVPYSGGTNFVTGDIGRRITDGTDFGTLLDFEVEPDGTLVAWIRPENATPTTGDVFDTPGSLTVVADGGTGASTTHTAATNGFSRYTAIQAIGSVPTATEVYIVQDRIKLANSADSAGFQFWATDPTVSLGIVSVLIRTHNAAAGVTNVDGIADSDLEVFSRRYTSLYDNFRLNVAAGGFSALPLASAPDINNTTGYRAAAWNAGTGTAMLVGDILTNTTQTGAFAVVTAVADSGTTGTFEYYLVGNLNDFVTTNTFTSPNRNGTINGAPTANLLGPTDATSGEGGTVTITIGHTTRDHDNSGTAEPYSIIVNAQSNVAIAKVYERIKYVTRRGSDNTFWDTVSTSVPGEQYRGIERLAYYAPNTGTLVQGEDLVNETQAGQTMRLVADNAAAAGEGVGQDYVTLMDVQTSIFTLADNDVLADSGSTDDVTIDTAGAGGAVLSVSSPKSSPFGTFTGTQIFGAQGVDFRNPGAGDAQAYILTDDLGTLRSPPNTITYSVANTRAGDRILVARDTGTSGVIDKDQFGGMTAVAASSKTITVAGSVDGEVPAAAVVRVVENTLQQEHRYYYASRTTGASGVFTLVDITAASATAGTSSTALSKTGGPSFITEGVQVGMLVQDTTNTGTYEVVSVDGADDLTIRHLYGADLFASGDAYNINETIQLYAVSDDIYDLILDYEEDVGTDGSPGSISNTLVKAGGSFGTVVQVRQGKVILPFTQNQSQGQTDTSVTAVRTPDTIAV